MKVKLVSRKQKKQSSDIAAGPGIKDFLVNHVEKIVFGLVAGLVLMLVYKSYGRASVNANQSPEALQQRTEQAKLHIEQDTWSAVEKTRYPKPDQFSGQAQEDGLPIDLASYRTPLPWDPMDFVVETKRMDPEILAVEDLEVYGGYGAIAMKRVDRFGAASRNSDLVSLPDDLQRFYSDMTSQPGGGSDGEAKGVYFVAVLGLVPYEKQQQAYDKAFLNKADFDATRDVPNYLLGRVERAEISSNDRSNWEPVKTNRAFQEQWASVGEEMAHVDHIEKSLVSDSPPLLLQDLSSFAVHSKLPTKAEIERQREVEREVSQRGQRRNARRNSGDLLGDEPVAVSRRNEGDIQEGTKRRNIQNLLFRFFDYTAKPGKRYHYRAQVWIEDANDPKDKTQRPRPRMLDAAVIDRLIRRGDLTPQQQNALERIKPFWRESPWSKPSDIVSIPPDVRMVAGRVSSPRLYRTKDKNTFENPNDESKATVVVVKWDNDLAMSVPVTREVRRGTVTRFKVDSYAIQPVQRMLKPLEGYEFVGDSVVLDLWGGAELPDKLRSLGEILVLDENGRLEVHKELSDVSEFSALDFSGVEDESISPSDDGDDIDRDNKEDRDTASRNRSR